jgi:hypothetical protein
MKFPLLLLCVCLAPAAASAAGHAPAGRGTIEGTVFNTTSGTAAPCPAEVGLQVQVKGQFVPLRMAATDEQGRFCFAGLPVGEDYLYLVGADRQGVFYPGPRILLSESHPAAHAELAVCDAVRRPSPLVLKKMDITIRPETGVLKVAESLLIDNPSRTTYIGEAAGDIPSATLVLSIPPEFERTTFEKEFYGRHFAVLNNKVVTGIPWTPGQRELKYTYVLRNIKEATVWQRPLDLPCADVTLRIEGKSPDEVRCDLLRQTQADDKTVVYTSAGQELAAGRVLRVELGRLPLPWMTYSKWAAVAILLLLIAVTGALHVSRRRAAPPEENAQELAQSKAKRAA